MNDAVRVRTAVIGLVNFATAGAPGTRRAPR